MTSEQDETENNREPASEKISPDINLDETELVKRLQSGDREAIEIIYVTYFDRLYSFVFHSVRRNQVAAEDIVQDVFLSALRVAKSFKGKSKIYTWLAGIAHHKIVDYYRIEKGEPYRYNNSEVKAVPIDLQSIADDSNSFSESSELEEMGDVIAAALSRMPLDYQQVLLFKYVEEMSTREICMVMNRSAKSVEGLITRARRILKEYLSGHEGKRDSWTTNKWKK